VIYWKDFILDDVMGPVLRIPESASSGKQSDRTETRDASCTDTEEGTRAQIQETRTEQRPARMVGPSDLDSSAQVDMDVSRSNAAQARLSVRCEGEA
jgi:hypothetical protein